MQRQKYRIRVTDVLMSLLPYFEYQQSKMKNTSKMKTEVYSSSRTTVTICQSNDIVSKNT